MHRFVIGPAMFSLALFAVSCEREQPVEEILEEEIRTIEIIGVDQMLFVVTGMQEGIVTGREVGEELLLEQILAEPGELLQIVLTNRSELPPAAMGHNFVLLALATDTEHFARESVLARDNEYIAPEFEDRVIAATRMLAGGESETIRFNVPEEPGEYDFVCSFPGHYSAGMAGQLIVRDDS